MTTASTIHARDLDQFVAECDKRGGPNHPDCGEYLRIFNVVLDTKVNEDLDPFSDEYVAQMVSVYEELAGRKLNQEQGEMTAIDVTAHAAAVSPYNTTDVRFLSKHNRAVTTAIMMAHLPAGAEVLDAGCGWGLSSEAMAFSGARVTALDINPLFVDLVRQRAARLGLPIDAVRAEFDKFQTGKQFDLLFFYECLHHSVKPWETLAHLGQFVKPEGKVVFAGEPIDAGWWRHWGLRLDSLAVYCIRKFGWWECSWSYDFITRCFARAGFALTIYPNVGLDCGKIGFAPRIGAGPGAAPDLSAWQHVPYVLTNAPPPAAAAPTPSLSVPVGVPAVGAMMPDSVHQSLTAMAGQIAVQAGELHTLRELVRGLTEQRHAEEKRTLSGDLAGHQAEIARLKHAIESMRASRSWRATAPVRSLLETLGGTRTKAAG